MKFESHTIISRVRVRVMVMVKVRVRVRIRVILPHLVVASPKCRLHVKHGVYISVPRTGGGGTWYSSRVTTLLTINLTPGQVSRLAI